MSGPGTLSNPSSVASWEFLKGNSGTDVAGNYWYVALYRTGCTVANGGYSTGSCENGVYDLDASLQMQVDVVPEPDSLALLSTGLLLGGWRIRRRTAWRG